jgi:cell division protein FtsB
MERASIFKNKKILAVSIVLGIVAFTTIMFNAKKIYHRINHLESVIDAQSGEIDQLKESMDEHKSEIDELKSQIEELQSER